MPAGAPALTLSSLTAVPLLHHTGVPGHRLPWSCGDVLCPAMLHHSLGQAQEAEARGRQGNLGIPVAAAAGAMGRAVAE